MKVYTKRDKTWGLLRTDCPPNGLMGVCKGFFIFTCVAAVFMFFFLLGNDFGFLPSLLFAAVLVGLGSLLLVVRKRAYQAWERFCEEMRQKEKEEEEKTKAFRKANEDELFYNECAKNSIHTHDAAGIARMQIVAKQMDISCSNDELYKKYLKGKAVVQEKEKIAAEKERKARIPILRKEEQLVEQEGRKYINLVGSDKRVRMFLDEAARYRSMVAQYERAGESITKGADALYSLHAGKETDWAVHGGVASAIAGSAAGVAVAVDIQRKNAEVRASNAQLRQTIGRFSAEQQLNMWMKQSEAEEKMKHYEAEAEKSKLKLVESLPQDDLLKLLYPIIEKKQTSETGAITFTVSINKASLTIFDTVNAVVDGSFKVKVMDGDRLAGEAYFTLPYNGSQRSSTLTSICASLPAEEKKYTFVFAPHNLFAIEM